MVCFLAGPPIPSSWHPDEDEEMADAAEPPAEPENIDKPIPRQEDLKVEATTKGGRRRGRRQIMKKAVKKDNEGYLGAFPCSMLEVSSPN